MNRIFTERLCLRQITEDDLQLYSEWSSSRDAHGDYLSPENHSYQECYERWKNHSFWNDHSKTLIIEHKGEQQPIGTIRYWQKSNDYCTVMIALKVAVASYRGQGLGTEAQRGLIHHLFSKEQYRAVEMFTDIDNVPEQRCLSKLGFTLTEIQSYEDQKVQRQGRLYRLERAEYDDRIQEYL